MFVKKRKGTHLYTNNNWRGGGGRGGGLMAGGVLNVGFYVICSEEHEVFFERAARWKRWVLRTDNVQGQIFQHIFAANGDYCINYPSNTHIQRHAYINPMRRKLFDGQTRGRGSKGHRTSGRLVERLFQSKTKYRKAVNLRLWERYSAYVKRCSVQTVQF